jgi:hypothetical protein
MRFVVKPLYLRRDGVTIERLYLVYETAIPVHDETSGRSILRPNYMLRGTGNVITELTRHFSPMGVLQEEWKVTPPIIISETEKINYTGSAQITGDC